MNRREFVKALGGIPLLRLLVKVPGAKSERYTMVSEGNGLIHNNDSIPDWLVERFKDENGDWHERVLLGTPPADLHWDDESPVGVSYWNGQAWVEL